MSETERQVAHAVFGESHRALAAQAAAQCAGSSTERTYFPSTVIFHPHAEASGKREKLLAGWSRYCIMAKLFTDTRTLPTLCRIHLIDLRIFIQTI
jgi:hypothetical protein